MSPFRTPKPSSIGWSVLFATTLSCASVALLPDTVHPQDLAHMTIDELLQLDVTSVSRKSEQLSKTAAAVFVITSEDIRRSGVTTIADALKLVPGVQSFRSVSSFPSVAIRGDANEVSDQVLVLQDGRTLFDHFANQTLWDLEDVMLEDIKQIEVIRGPGGTIWGENAFTGVINIVTKNAQDTQGTLLTAGGGSYEKGFGSARHGGKIGETAYRIWAKAFSRGEFDAAEPSFPTNISGVTDPMDAWHGVRSGFRLDSDPEESSVFHLSGDISLAENRDEVQSDIGLITGVSDEISSDQERFGAHVLAEYKKKLSFFRELQLRSYYMHRRRDTFVTELVRDTFDVEGQYRFPVGDRHEFIVGTGYRHHFDDIAESTVVTADPSSDDYTFYNVFMQDEIELAEDLLTLTLGARLSHNDFTGFEFLPQVRSAWTPSEAVTIWGAVARSVRTPSRADEDQRSIQAVLPPSASTGGLPLVINSRGSDSIKAINLTAYEIGVRNVLSDSFALDVAAFFFDFTDYFSSEINLDELSTQQEALPLREASSQIGNELKRQAWGVELLADYRPLDDLRLVFTYAFLDQKTFGGNSASRCETLPGAFPFRCEDDENLANHIVSFNPRYNISSAWSIDGFLQWVSSFDSQARRLDGGVVEIDDYLLANLRVAWRAQRNLEFSIVGQNLIEDGHAEWGQLGVAEVPRGLYVKAMYEF